MNHREGKKCSDNDPKVVETWERLGIVINSHYLSAFNTLRGLMGYDSRNNNRIQPNQQETSVAQLYFWVMLLVNSEGQEMAGY